MKKLLVLFLLLFPVLLLAGSISDFNGRWEIIPGKSIDLGRFGGFVLDIKTNENDLTILKERIMGGGVIFRALCS